MSKKILMIMVDGFGIPPEGWRDSIFSRYCSEAFLRLLETHSTPLDACLGVEGLPQSATGQSSLFTGYNAAAIMDRHVQGFPGKRLRKLIRKRNIFSSLINEGKKVTFVNAYVRHNLETLKHLGYRSVTTVMTDHAIGSVRGAQELSRGEAVYHDLTRHTLMSSKTMTESDRKIIEIVSPEMAADHFLNIAMKHDFSLFEYFITDRAGHKMDEGMLKLALGNLSEFIDRIVEKLAKNTFLILSSDHGNCEEQTSKPHTTNPVPLLCFPELPCSEVKSITDVFKLIMDSLK